MLYVFYCYYLECRVKYGAHTLHSPHPAASESLLSRPELSPVTPRPVSCVCCTGPWRGTRAVVTGSTRQSRQRCAMVSTWSENIRCSVNVTARHNTSGKFTVNSKGDFYGVANTSQVLMRTKWGMNDNFNANPSTFRDVSFELVDSFDKETISGRKYLSFSRINEITLYHFYFSSISCSNN